MPRQSRTFPCMIRRSKRPEPSSAQTPLGHSPAESSHYPWLTYFAVSCVQLKMLNELSELYGVPFSDNVAKNLISALLGSLIPSGLTHGTVGYLLRSVPLVGPALGALTMPSFASAATWAIGRVFVQHFESGGTFLDFDPIKVREYFRSEFARAQDEMKGKPGVSR